MNANIEVINDHILAVDFRLIPGIKDIRYESKQAAETNIDDLLFSFSYDGRVLLNKNSQLYDMAKGIFIGFDKYSDKELIEIKDCGEVHCENDIADMMIPFIREWIGRELERRGLFRMHVRSNKGLSKVIKIILTKITLGKE
jgi:hypothetical protein